MYYALHQIAAINAVPVDPGPRSGISASSSVCVAVREPSSLRTTTVTATTGSSLSAGQRHIQRAPELQVACGGNAIWRGLGGGVFSSIASVSPTLSYYLGGTMIWAMTQTIRALSEAPATRTSSHSTSSSSSSANGTTSPQKRTAPISTYTYTVLSALTQQNGTHKANTSASPSIGLLALLCRDLLGCGRYHCCAVMMSGLLSSPSSATLRNLLHNELKILYLNAPDSNENKTDVTEEEKESSISTAAGEVLSKIASSFRLKKLIFPEGWDRNKNSLNLNSNMSSGQIRYKEKEDLLMRTLAQPLQGSYLRQKCEREMIATQQPSSNLKKRSVDSSNGKTDVNKKENGNGKVMEYKKGNEIGKEKENRNEHRNAKKNGSENGMNNGSSNAYHDERRNENVNENGHTAIEGDVGSATTLVTCDVTTSTLKEAYRLRSLSRELFLSAAGIAGRVLHLNESLDEEHQVQLDQCVTNLLTVHPLVTFSTPISRAEPALHSLPTALHAISNIDVGYLSNNSVKTSPDNYKKGVDGVWNVGPGSIGSLLCSLCVALLLAEDVSTAAAVAASVFGRTDIEKACRLLRCSTTSTSTPTLNVSVNIEEGHVVSDQHAAAAALDAAFLFFSGEIST